MIKKESDETISDKARFESHALSLGKLTGNLQSIEMGARLAIIRLDQSATNFVQVHLPQVKTGDLVELNAFTNNHDLTQTLEKCNKLAPINYRIDIRPIVSLRDALAHGRTFGFDSIKHLRLLKFHRKAKDGKVTVEFAVDMTDEWFQDKIRLLNHALEKIRKTLNYEAREFT
jgi:hypothetical protein